MRGQNWKNKAPSQTSSIYVKYLNEFEVWTIHQQTYCHKKIPSQQKLVLLQGNKSVYLLHSFLTFHKEKVGQNVDNSFDEQPKNCTSSSIASKSNSVTFTIRCIWNASRRVKALPTFIIISGRFWKEAASATLTDGFVYPLLYIPEWITLYLFICCMVHIGICTLKWYGLRIVHCTRCISACRFWFWISSVRFW